MKIYFSKHTLSLNNLLLYILLVWPINPVLLEKQKADQELSVNLMFPSPSNLKNECLSQFKSLTNKADIRMMKSFFGKNHEDELLTSKIRVSDRNKFRLLWNFLLNEMKTQEKKVELLTLFIDFDLRPYSIYYKSDLNKNQGSSNPISEELPASSKSQNPISENKEKQRLGS